MLHRCLKNVFVAMILFLPFVVFSQGVKFNNNFSMACHNCYEAKHAPDFQDVFLYTKTIEIDIWNSDFGLGFIANLLGRRMEGDWYVKHQPQERGNNNNVGGTFRDCLDYIKQWSDMNPNHDIITVFIDKKQNWSAPDKPQSPADLDKLLLSIFPKEKIFTPADLLQDKTDLKEAANYNWPTLDSLKGKFVFVITDGTFLNGRKPLNEYLDARKTDAVCFVSPRIKKEEEINLPKRFSNENARNVVFYNLKSSDSSLSDKINDLQCISRTYGSSKEESENYYEKLVNHKVNFIAFYNYKACNYFKRGQNILMKRKLRSKRKDYIASL